MDDVCLSCGASLDGRALKKVRFPIFMEYDGLLSYMEREQLEAMAADCFERLKKEIDSFKEEIKGTDK